jgi:hypothetical protein
MPGKPGYYKTGDMAGIFVGEHVENISYRASTTVPVTETIVPASAIHPTTSRIGGHTRENDPQ